MDLEKILEKVDTLFIKAGNIRLHTFAKSKLRIVQISKDKSASTAIFLHHKGEKKKNQTILFKTFYETFL